MNRRSRPFRKHKLLIFALAAITLASTAHAQLSTEDLTGTLTPTDLANTLVGGGITVSNVTFTGVEIAGGEFAGGTGIIGFESGILLSSGDIVDVIGPNTSDGQSTNSGQPGDADLDALAGFDTFDAAILEFDFVPDGSVVSFNYVFSSEEYNEYVNSDFNDVFGFFVNEVNCALVEGDPVTINTINNGNPFNTDPRSHPELYINNDLDDGGGSINTEMDGLTVVLTCTAAVEANETNHMKLAIADGSDFILDSNVFLEAESFVVIQESIILSPEFATNPVGTEHTVTATVFDEFADPLPDRSVTIEITSGPNAGVSGTGVTDESGMFSLTYTDAAGPGVDILIASFEDSEGQTQFSNEAQKEWLAGDQDPPECYLLSVDPGPPMAIQIFTQDTGSGMADITVLDSDNATVNIPDFAVGTTDPVIVNAGKVDQTLPAFILLEVTDVDGNSTECDPVLAKMEIPQNRQRAVERFKDIPSVERFVTVKGGIPGVRMVAIAVNRKMVAFVPLKANQEKTLDLGPAIPSRKNTIAIWAFGRPGSTVTVLISDGVGADESLRVMPGRTSRGGMTDSNRDLTWGKRKR